MNYKEFEQIAKEWNGKVCLFGAGQIGKTWGYEVAIAAGFSVDFYCDNHIAGGIEIRNFVKTISPQELYSLGEKVLVLLTVKETYQDNIILQLHQKGIGNILPVGNVFLQEIYFSIEAQNDNELNVKYKMLMDDAKFLKMRFKEIMGYPLDLDNAKTFNEKLNWLKIYDRKKEYIRMVDKAEVKEYVADIIGEEYVIPTYGVWDNVDEIDFDLLPNQFVIKTTNDSGSVVICEDKNQFDKNAACEKIKEGMKINYYINSREWPYKNIKPRIIAEEKIAPKTGELADYKLMCFQGNVKCSFVCTERFGGDGLKVTFFDRNWKEMPFERHYRASKEEIKKPRNYEKMIELAERLAKDFPFVRVDFYDVEDKVYFGELTFFPGSGFEEFTPEEWDEKLGDWIKLPKCDIEINRVEGNI